MLTPQQYGEAVLQEHGEVLTIVTRRSAEWRARALAAEAAHGDALTRITDLEREVEKLSAEIAAAKEGTT